MTKKFSLTAVSLALALTACDKPAQNNNQTETVQGPSETVASAPYKKGAEQLNALYQQATKALFSQRAFSATSYGLSPEEVGGYYNDKVENFSPLSEQQLRASLAKLSAEISEFPLSSTQQIDLDNQQVMASITRYFSGSSQFNIGYIDTWMGLSPFIINQINGPLISIPRSLQNDHQIRSEKEALDYLARLGQFGQVLSSIEEKFLADANNNWLPPKVTLNGALRYMNAFIKESPENNPLAVSFREKVNKVDSLSEAQKTALVAQAVDKVSLVVYPAYQSVIKTTESMLIKARDESGIWAQPNGDAFYQDAIKQLGDSTLTAAEIHDIGLSEVTRITETMNKILVNEGYTKGTVGERMISLVDEDRFLYEDSDEGRKKILSDINGYIVEITTLMAPVFKTTPSYAVEVRSYPVELQDGAPGGEYNPPSVDGTKPGIYWINLKDMKANPKFGLKTLTYHEANPGHHWQIALNMEQDALPFLRRIAPYNAYTEGWALYSEKVAEELGVYDNDPFGNLGRLRAELFRAVRLVVDTGLHNKQWTREQAIDYMIQKTGSAESEVTSEIERYMTWPGQALGYKLGMLKILSLREQAQKALGDKFDLNAFHDLVLLGGAVPMAVLERKVNQWVEQQKSIN